MEIRKIQKTGGSTLVVSLPKVWCQNFNLKVGSKVVLNYNERGGIMLEPFDKAQDTSAAIVDVKKDADLEIELRTLISKYIQGVRKMTIKAENKKMLDDIIRRFLDLTIGFEIIDEKQNEATMEDLISLPMLTFEKGMKRMVTLVRGIVAESVNPQKIPLEYVLQKENEVDKFNIYIQRLFSQSLKDYSVLQLNKISSGEALSYLLISRILERIADHGVRIYKLLNQENAGNRDIIQYINDATESMGRAMEYFFKKDVKGANEEISRKEYFKRQRDQINRSIQRYDNAITLSEILEDAERIALYSSDICELTLDYSE
ncbi:MAG: phosphate uptake regulator PhoU [Thermoplasmatales archaeon]